MAGFERKMELKVDLLFAAVWAYNHFGRKKYGTYYSLRYADQVHNNGIYLPINADMTKRDVSYVCQKFKKIAKPFAFD